MINELLLDEHGMLYKPLDDKSILKTLFASLQAVEMQISSFIINSEKLDQDLQNITLDLRIAEREHTKTLNNNSSAFLLDKAKARIEISAKLDALLGELNKTIYWSFVKHEAAFGACQGVVEVDNVIQQLTPLFKDLSYLFTGLTEKIKSSEHPLDPKKHIYQFTKSFIENNHGVINEIHAGSWRKESQKLLDELLYVPLLKVRSVTGYHKRNDGVWVYCDQGTRSVQESFQDYYAKYGNRANEIADLHITLDKLIYEFEIVDMQRMLLNIQNSLNIHLKHLATYAHACSLAMHPLNSAIQTFDAGKTKPEYQMATILPPFFKKLTDIITTLSCCMNTLLLQQQLFSVIIIELSKLSASSRKAAFYKFESDVVGL